MGKAGWTTLLLMVAAFAADHYLNYGRYTEGLIAVLRQFRRLLGW